MRVREKEAASCDLLSLASSGEASCEGLMATTGTWEKCSVGMRICGSKMLASIPTTIHKTNWGENRRLNK